MNNRELKRELKRIYLPPAARGRDAFLESWEAASAAKAGPDPRHTVLSLKDFLLVQLRYINPHIWWVNGIFFLLMTGILREISRSGGMGESQGTYGMMAKLSALMPVLAIFSLAELNRSARYHMDELEMSTRFSLKAVLLARMEILGCCNLLLFLAVVPFALYWGKLTWTEIGLCLFTPYCLTTMVILWVARHGRQLNPAICLAAAAGVFFWGSVTSQLYTLMAWLLDFSHPGLLLLGILLMTGYECRKYVSQCGQEITGGVFSQ